MAEAGNVPLGPQRDRLERITAACVVGEPEQLGEVLTSDARGWSPALSYWSRFEAVTLLRDHATHLLVVEFTPSVMWWIAPCVCAYWSLVAIHAEPLLVADDVLVDACDEPVYLSGASMITLRAERATAVDTYYDEGSLVEQVILRSNPGREEGGISPLPV